MTWLPPSGGAVRLEGVSGFVPNAGDDVLLQPVSDPTFLSLPIAQAWQQNAAGFKLRHFVQQWSLPTLRFQNYPVQQGWEVSAPRFRSRSLDLRAAIESADFADVPLDQSWSLQPFAYADLPIHQQWRQKNLVIREYRFHAQWLLEATAVWTPVISATVYCFALENPRGRAEMPISNFSGQLRSGEPSYLQVTVPNAKVWAEVIADFGAQSDTEIVIQAGYRYSDGHVRTQEIARTRLRNVRYDLGARSSSVQLDGIDTRINPTPKTVSLTGANYRSQDESGRVRYRCAMNFDVRPGDTALINSESLMVGELSYNVTVNNAALEVVA